MADLTDAQFIAKLSQVKGYFALSDEQRNRLEAIALRLGYKPPKFTKKATAAAKKHFSLKG